jgi:hypothetical protein
MAVGAEAAAQWDSPRFSTYEVGSSRVCGESCSTAIIGLHAPTAPPIYIALCERGPLPMGMTGVHDQGALGDPF